MYSAHQSLNLSQQISDGPNGIRGNHFFMGTPAKALPCGTALGATWDMDLVEQAASKLLAEEAKLRGASVILAPTVNIQRVCISPLDFSKGLVLIAVG